MGMVVVYGLMAAALLLLIYALVLEPNQVRLSKLSIANSRLKGSFRVLHITDTHLFSGMPVRRWRTLIHSIQSVLAREIPDLVLLTGDLIDKDDGIPMLRGMLQTLKSKQGIYAVLGNHDYRQYNFLHIFYPWFYKTEGKITNLPALKDCLIQNGVVLLDHSTHDITIGSNKIELVGIDPRSYDSPELVQWTRLDKSSFRLVLSHYPDVIRRVAGQVDLVLSGHTHGGQITLLGWPLITKSKLPRRLITGLHDVDNTLLYVSRGVGVSHYIPFRLGSPPEITEIQLRGDAS